MQGKCPTPPPPEVGDGTGNTTLPAGLFSSFGWPYATLPALTKNQCVLRIASGFVYVTEASELWLDNVVIQAPYLFDVDEAVAPTAADLPPKKPGDDYTEEFEPAAPAPYDFDYDAAYAPVPDDAYGGPLPADAYADYAAPAPGPAGGADVAAEPPLPPAFVRQYEGREAYPDYEEAVPASGSFERDTDLARSRVLRGSIIGADGPAFNFSEVPTRATAPLPTKIWLTDVTLSGGAKHVDTSGASVYASGASLCRPAPAAETCACALATLQPQLCVHHDTMQPPLQLTRR